jgi:L-alanine-DL-glutamate epimerase-like enolase superfamily enzyme
MKIRSLEVTPFALPFKEPYVTARGRLERREMALLRLHTDEGVEGLGEAVPLSLRGASRLGEVVRELRGSDGELREGLSPPARAAIEMARLDLDGKLAGVPLWRLLGAESAAPVPCNATLTAADPEFVAVQATRWADLGFESFKLKVGIPGDVRQVEAVRDAVGPQARIRVDANGSWSPHEAVMRLAGMERFGLELAEQPCPDLEDLAVVRGQTAVPLAADESVASVADAERANELGACQLATVKLAKVGGTDGARGIAERLPIYLSSALDGPVGIAAAAHLFQALSREGPAGALAQGLATPLLFAETIASRGCEFSRGLLYLPDGPGLGVEIDEAALERHRL